MKKEGGSSSSVPGFMYSVYHVTLIHPIEPSIYFLSFAILRGDVFDNFYIRWVQRPSIAACSLDCARHAGYRPAEVFASSILTGQ
jgi:hypothetical protein